MNARLQQIQDLLTASREALESADDLLAELVQDEEAEDFDRRYIQPLERGDKR